MRHRALLIFTVGFAVGIATASFLTVNWILCAVICLFCLFSTIFVNRAFPLVILVAGVAFGAFRLIAFFPPGWNVDSLAGPAPVTMVGSVASDPVVDQHKTTFLLSTDAVETREGEYLTRTTTDVIVHGAAYSTFVDVRYGDRVKVSGELQKIFPATNPGEFDWRTHLIHRGITGEMVVQRPFGATVIRPSGIVAAIEDWSTRVEHTFKDQLSAVLPSDESGILIGILFGDRSGLSPQLQREFAATGTAHVLATAGLHVGILSLCLVALFGVLPISRRFASASIIVLLWAFAALAGGRPAVVRAVSAATVFFGGRLFERVPDAPTTIAAAALGILLFEPPVLFDSDFQMSFVTVAGLSIYVHYWEMLWKDKIADIRYRQLRRPASWLTEIVGISLIAQLASTPLTVYYFNSLSVLSLPVNFIVVPLLFFLIPCAVFALPTMLISPTLGAIIVKWLLHPVLHLIITTVGWFSGQTYCSIAVASPPWYVIAVIYAIAFGLGLKLSHVKHVKRRELFKEAPAP